MKIYKQILEAVKRGINLALDDFEDDNNLQTLSYSKIKSKNYTEEYLYLKNNFVDLGLPSGTLWCKYNLGANIENPEKFEDLIGNYYAWGELEPNKPMYDLKTYKFTKLEDDKPIISKYNENDKLTQLLPADDIVTQTFNGNKHYHIPTKELWEELLEYTNINFSNNQPFDLHTYVLISTINNEKLYFYASFHQTGKFKISKTDTSGIWTSDYYYNKYKNNLWSYRTYFCMIAGHPTAGLNVTYRHSGNVIRPVYN